MPCVLASVLASVLVRRLNQNKYLVRGRQVVEEALHGEGAPAVVGASGGVDQGQAVPAGIQPAMCQL